MSQRPIHQCQCEICQSPQPHADKDDHQRMNVLLSRLNEQQRRWYVGLEAERIGHGGTERLAQITGMNVNTIRRGRRELGDVGRAPNRPRAHAGRWAATAGKKSSALKDTIREIVNDDIAGMPTGEKKWVRLSLRTIVSRLDAQAYNIGRTTVSRLLRKLGFGLVANRKSLTGAVHLWLHSSCATAVPARRLSCHQCRYQEQRTDRQLRQSRSFLASDSGASQWP